MHASQNRQPVLQFSILAIIVLRIVLLFLPSFKIDMTDWQAWAARLVEVGPLHFYAPNYFTDYFPGYLYILWLVGWLYQLVAHPQGLFSDQFAILLKLITTVFDFATAYLLIKIITPFQPKLRYSIAVAYLLNPAGIFNTAVWGQIDGILTFFMILSCYLLLYVKKQKLFSLASAWAVVTKPQAILMLPVLGIASLTENGLKKTVKIYIIMAALFFIIALPFFPRNPLVGPFALFASATNVYPYTSLYALNVWAIIGWWQSDLQQFWHISYQSWGFIMYGIAMVGIVGLQLRRRVETKHSLIFLALALSFMTFYLFPTRIHERYLFPCFGFLLIAAYLYRSIILGLVYGVLCIVHFLNLWYVYFYYNVLYNNPNPPVSTLYDFINNNHVHLAVITLACYGIMLVLFCRPKKGIV